MGKVPQSRYTMELSIPSIPLSSNFIVVKPRGQGLRMRYLDTVYRCPCDLEALRHL